jgi:hypothetical protein
MRAAAALGRADLLRLLGKPLAVAALLDELCPEDALANENAKLVPTSPRRPPLFSPSGLRSAVAAAARTRKSAGAAGST